MIIVIDPDEKREMQFNLHLHATHTHTRTHTHTHTHIHTYIHTNKPTNQPTNQPTNKQTNKQGHAIVVYRVYSTITASAVSSRISMSKFILEQNRPIRI